MTNMGPRMLAAILGAAMSGVDDTTPRRNNVLRGSKNNPLKSTRLIRTVNEL